MINYYIVEYSTHERLYMENMTTKTLYVYSEYFGNFVEAYNNSIKKLLTEPWQIQGHRKITPSEAKKFMLLQELKK